MPLTFEMNPIHGVAAELAFDGDMCMIEVEGYYSTEDGGKFIQLVEEMSRTFLHRASIRPSQIDNFLLLLDLKNQATLYCNELVLAPLIRANRTIKAQDKIFDDDLVDCEALQFYSGDKKRIEIAENCGIVFLFSIGWRKAIYFNFRPLHPNTTDTLTGISQLLGRLFGQLFFQEKTKLTEEQWNRLFEWGWFPFCGLTRKELSECAAWTTQSRYPESPIRDICKRFQRKIPELIESWKKRPEFSPHMPFVESAYATLQQENFIATIQTLMPRIQGIMHKLLSKKAGQKPLAESVVKNHDSRSLLLPEKFKEYILTCYFKDFDLEAGNLSLARHSIAHGVSNAADYNEITATIPFLIFDQIYYFLPVLSTPSPPPEFVP